MSEPAAPLSFIELERMVSEHLPDYDDGSSKRSPNFGYALLIGSFGFNLVSTYVFKSLPFTLFTFVAEIIGLIWSITSIIRYEWPQLRNHKSGFAATMDFHYQGVQAIIGWLHSFPKDEVAKHLAYARDRQASLQQRFSLLFGSIDKFGLLSIIAALYLQLKDFRFHWPLEVSVIPALCGFALLILYCVAMLASSWKLRVALYERLLYQAINPPAAELAASRQKAAP
ncbi:hypothetical protein [Solimonas marina]|uniref:Uncharacterized protein n=1 Tax=Solimonas marina TaxID=2714601 RepID=A0A969WC13_9GAMM|nr:hypothetical protein [Solimonas marina]NKF24162.1 hypothetical protein [Solimonas marina]